METDTRHSILAAMLADAWRLRGARRVAVGQQRRRAAQPGMGPPPVMRHRPAAMAETGRKTLHFVRHGESVANEAIAEALAAAGLSDADDSFKGAAREISYTVMNDPARFDSDLSTLGIQQATALATAAHRPEGIELLVASSLSRAIHTAALAFPESQGFPRPILCLDETREFAGPPTSEKRHRASQMRPHLAAVAGLRAEELDISRVPEEDDLWQPREEGGRSAFSRADNALAFLMARPERVIACVGHTSFMRRCLLGSRNRSVVVHGSEQEKKALWRAFENCEVRSVEMWQEPGQPGKFLLRPLKTPVAAAAPKL
jgi:broad specificity phosphatase PhoE